MQSLLDWVCLWNFAHCGSSKECQTVSSCVMFSRSAVLHCIVRVVYTQLETKQLNITPFQRICRCRFHSRLKQNNENPFELKEFRVTRGIWWRNCGNFKYFPVEVLIDNIMHNCLWSSLRQAAYWSDVRSSFVPTAVVSLTYVRVGYFKKMAGSSRRLTVTGNGCE
jgi:hypothetical protein